MKFTVIVVRPLVFTELVAGFDSAQELQYVATGVDASGPQEAGNMALTEAFYADLEHTTSATGQDLFGLKAGDYTVLGTIEDGGNYMPWFNGARP